ncbi:CHRD domain-containing protein [Neorhodopirellula lusitana]|uniref:CHRD domain-containing protein n=1 Tax=Neorhodopirellula lusitana TaxID=445327 RepID=UPI0038501D65
MFGLSDTSLFANRPTRKPQRSSTRKSSSRRRRSTISQLIGERLEDRRVLASYIVNTAADVVAEDGMVSLREAILSANNNAAENADTVAGDSGATITDTIEFAEGLTTITLGSELAISDSVAISLGDSTSQTISGGNASRIFSIVANGETGAATSVSISGLTLSDGIADSGGAIFVSTGQTLSLDSVTLTDNVATGSGPDAGGGALFNDGGIVTVVDSTISGNTAAASASVALTGAEEVPMVSTTASGDATFVYDAATNTFSIDLLVTGLEVADDSDDIPQVTGAHLHLGEVGANGDVIVNLDAANFTTEDDGGIRLQLTDAAFPAENVADLIAGGLYINVHSDANPSGEVRGQLVFPTTMGSGGGLFNHGGSLSVTNSTIANNVASRAGGGIESAGGNLILTGVDLTDNVAGPEGFASPGNGGGLHISGMGDATITNGTVSGNTAAREGGGLWNSVGIMTIDGTTITGNTASGDAADDGGGGVFNNGGTLTVSNATITGNTADGTLGSGGGIFSTAGNVTVNSTQIGGANAADGNTANRAGGGIEVVDGKVTLNFGTDVSSNHAGINGGGLHSTGAAVVTSNLAIFASNTADSEGGGLWNSSTGTLDINGGAISSNVASGDESDNGGGGVFNDGGSVTIDDAAIAQNVADGTAGSGGGILNDGGSLTIGGVTNIANNRANRAGGGIEATAGSTTILTGVKLDSNSAGVSPATAAPGNGGGLHISGSGNATITGGTVDNNTAASEGGGLWNDSGTMIVTGTTITNNTASGMNDDNGGGGLFNNGGTLEISDATITGNSSDGPRGGGGGVMNVAMGVLDISGTTISNNTATGTMMGDGGGAVLNIDGSVTINDSILSGNTALGTSGSGGAILSRAGSLTVSDSTIAGNSANRAGGGIELGRATVVLTNVVIGGDEASDGNSVAGVGANPGNGGGIHTTFETNITITGGRIQNNSAVEGGGLWNSGTGSLTVDGTTIADNTAVRGGGVFQDETSTTQTFTVDLQTLNAAYGSTASGTATITLDTSAVTGPESGVATIRVQIDADGLQDLSGVTGGVHVAHIHGQFAGNAFKPLAEQGGGLFFSGEGGTAADSVAPTTADDGAKNIDESERFGEATDYLDFFEGRPDYGPVVLNLTNEQLASAPDGTGPLTFFFQELAAGNIPADAFPNGTEFTRDTTYTFDLSDADERRQYNNLSPLEAREIVLHGLTVPTEISDAIDGATGASVGSPTAGVALGNGMSFRRTAPVAAGEIVATSGSTTITNSTLSGNTASGDDATDGGGGIHNLGSLTVTDSTITTNVASGSSGSGGGVANAGTATLSNTMITSNTANRAGGGIEAFGDSSTTLTGVNLDSNNAGISPATAAPGNGGGLHISGSGNATITGGTVDNNTAASEGGGLWNGGGTMTVDGTSITGNVASGDDADNGGGGIFNNGGELIVVSAMITGNVADGTSGSGGGILNLGTASFVDTTISGNTANRAGGGVEVTSGSTTTFQSVTLNTNVAGPADTAAPGNGGGLHISGDGVVSIADTTVDGNTAANEGGGLWNSPAGTLDVQGSTVSNNSSGDGGGIFNQGTTGDITVTNSSVAGNTASVAGGGIASEGANVTLTSVTIADNTAATGGGISAGTSVVTAINSLIADNNATTSPDLDGALTSNGNNLIGDTTGTTLIGSDASDVLDVDPLLAALADNGGPTQTIALLTDSPALDAGVAAGLMTDQRGIARPQGPAIDIGAFESDLAATEDPTTLSIAPTTADQNEGDSGTTAFTFTITRGGNTQGETTVQYTVSGTGSDPATQTDFDGGVFPTGTVSFSDGEFTQLLTINVLGDNGIEQDERFSVTLSNPSGNTTIATAVANGTILDDDFVEIQTNIFVPRFIARPHVIPGNNAPTAIIFQAVSSTIVTVTPVATASASETFRISDGNTNPISSFTNGVATATIEAGELYAVVFEAQTSQRIYTIRSSAGEDALLNTSPTNIFQPTDTNGSGETTAVDALLVINELNRQDSGGEGEPLLNAASNFLDVNRDAKVSPLDALTVINHLNSQNRTPSSSEGELVVAPALETNPGSSSLVMTTDEGALDAFFAEDELPQNPVSFDTLAPSPTLVVTEAQTDSIFNDQEYSNSSLDAELAIDIELLASGS